ncbi:TonB-dependent receptor [Robertkochia aurantiaca]|uniref:TonB-dependent receptor n=1 Tax=Robertkochia aurantiaca TaxID=2873700 RepID=UPI001CCF9A2B|nr:carboxypeptidase regulatory-like domain-containing protein [Robertkochia sp. 3YJGBD-33]
MSNFNRLCLLVVMLFTAIAGYSQGVTTASMGGQVEDNNGEPLPGANVVAVHLPSGTTYGATTDFDGFYRLSGMRPGGPYQVTISYIGFQDATQSDLYLQLGQTERINAQLQESATELDEVVVTGTSTGIFSANKTGAETTITNREVQTIPAASRSIADFVRVTPQASITEGNDGFSISVGGQNNRYNAIYIDGAVNNDVFGLAGSGTNGGQTGVNPFSVDAIESFQVQLAPFDVKISGFSGGAISAITRSGDNNFEGSAYYFLRNESLAGKTPPSLVGEGETRERLSDFSAQTYGFRLGGPIIEDKLFFFVNYERQDDETPQPFNLSNYRGDSGAAELENLRQFLINTYGYDPGGYADNTRTLVSDKITARIDWNINDRNKLMFKHSYVGADNLEARSSGNSNIGFINGSEEFISKTNSTSIEWNYSGNKYSNSLIMGYTQVRDDRDPSGQPFPTVDIFDGEGFISLGSEPFSTANLLDQDIFTFTNNFEIYKGRHTITLGTHNEYSNSKNLFFPFNYGDYTYTSVQGFINNDPDALDFYQHGYSLVGDGTVGDASAGAAEFSIFQLGFYVQDQVQVSDNLRVSAGIRFDTPFWDQGPVNNDFNNRTVDLLEAQGKDLQGARVGQPVSTIIHVSPRAGFNWDVFGNRTTQVRGGFGIFTSRLPLVWPGGAYNNNGITSGFAASFNTDVDSFNPDVNDQPVNVEPGSGGTGGNIDLIASDFMLPQVFKTNLAIDQKLPIWDLVFTAEGIWNDNINAVYYENLNIKGPVGTLNGADNRPFYNRFDLIDPTYGGIYLLSNTSEGYSWNTTFTLTKPFSNGFGGSVSYTYGDARAIFDGTSSQNSSQWRNIQTVNGKNSNLPTTRSDFAQGSRVIANVSYALNWNENVKTTIGLFYEGSQSQPITYIYNEGRDLLNDDSRDNALIYVPASQDEINLIDTSFDNGATVTTAQEQWEALDAFIEGNEYLRGRRGQYAERNGEWGPWSNIIDLKVLQDFTLNIGQKSHTLQLSADIFNFTNLINKDWGKKKFVPGFGEVGLITTEQGGPDPEFTFNPSLPDRIIQLDDAGIQSSRWQIQFGVRYLFN